MAFCKETSEWQELTSKPVELTSKWMKLTSKGPIHG